MIALRRILSHQAEIENAKGSFLIANIAGEIGSWGIRSLFMCLVQVCSAFPPQSS
jgi:hypothetical protein